MSDNSCLAWPSHARGSLLAHVGAWHGDPEILEHTGKQTKSTHLLYMYIGTSLTEGCFVEQHCAKSFPCPVPQESRDVCVCRSSWRTFFYTFSTVEQATESVAGPLKATNAGVPCQRGRCRCALSEWHLVQQWVKF